MLGTKGTRRISSLGNSDDGGMAKNHLWVVTKKRIHRFTPNKNVDFLGR